MTKRVTAIATAALSLLLLAWSAAAQGPPSTPPSLQQLRQMAQSMTPETQAFLAPLTDAVAKVREEQAKMPPPKDDAEKLRRLGALDQAPRAALSKLPLSQLPSDQRRAASAAIGAQLIEIDEANLKALLAILPEEGWFSRSVYGAEAAKAAFHIVQHSNPATWRRFVPVLERYAQAGEIDRAEYAKMWDRLALAEGRLQRYGTQMRCDAGRWAPSPMEDTASVELARKSAGMEPLGAYLKGFESMRC